ncbi:MAG: ATP-dependent sacrificial sulfur transferase LarE [Candidatus Eremiobacteraeota bacterium]|nr:ATP-dependent sacrificial sulfur transferase LarE [Candidatus Eremiobacteraeota bacterium]
MIDDKERRLREIVRGYGRCIVAFSGGVDSALVVAIAARELGDDALAVTGVSPSLPRSERESAADFARIVGARHELLDTHELDDPNYASNPANRCYFCKSELYGRLQRVAAAGKYGTIADGLNYDDLAEMRHGRRAADEVGVRSPLAEAELTKDDVRTLARRLGLDVWDKPAAACLSSRFPTGTAITLELLERVEAAERSLADAGLREYRVRHHGDVARIEVPVEAMAAVLERREEIIAGVRAAGYRFVSLDLGGYVRGGVAATATPGNSVIDLVTMT